MHGHPPHGLFHPLVKPQLAKRVLLGGVLARRVARGAYLIHRHRDPKRGVGLVPDLFIRPVIIQVCAVDHRVEGGVVFLARQNVACFLVLLVADAVGVGACGGDEEVQRLGARITRALGHHVEQGPVGLGVQLVEYDTGDVEPVLGVRLSREHLVEAVGRLVDDPLLTAEDFHPLR